jgi:hypothetical protein
MVMGLGKPQVRAKRVDHQGAHLWGAENLGRYATVPACDGLEELVVRQGVQRLRRPGQMRGGEGGHDEVLRQTPTGIPQCPGDLVGDEGTQTVPEEGVRPFQGNVGEKAGDEPFDAGGVGFLVAASATGQLDDVELGIR